MMRRRALFDWRVTRALFSLGVFAILGGIVRLVLAPSELNWPAIAGGVAAVVLSTWGPWDSEASGRNRSVLGLRVSRKLDE